MKSTTLRRKVNESGSNFFSPGAMRAFESHLHDKVYHVGGHVYRFITSESFDDGETREYSVREVNLDPSEAPTYGFDVRLVMRYPTYDEAVANIERN